MIFVTGGTGMLGSYLLFDLAVAGFKIRALKRKSSNLDIVNRRFRNNSDNAENLLKQIEWVDGDIQNYNDLIEAMNGIDQVYHLAAMVSFDPTDDNNMYKNNVQGTANIVNVAIEKNIRKLCYASSIAALGSVSKTRETTNIDENTERNSDKKHSVYSLSKYKAEMEIWRGIAEGLNAVIVNPSVILGAGNWETGSPKLISTIYKGLKFYTNGITGFVYAKDVSKAMINLMDSNIKNERFVLSAENYSYKQLFASIAKHLKINAPSIYIKPFISEIVWRIMWIGNKFLGMRPILTKNTARSAHNKAYYSSQKIIDTLDFKFQSIDSCLNIIAKEFLNNKLKQ